MRPEGEGLCVTTFLETPTQKAEVGGKCTETKEKREPSQR